MKIQLVKNLLLTSDAEVKAILDNVYAYGSATKTFGERHQ